MRGILLDVRRRNRVGRIASPGIGQAVPGRRPVTDLVLARIGFINDLALEQDGILGGKCLRRIDRKLCPVWIVIFAAIASIHSGD